MNGQKSNYSVIGMMSGTSLDGIDLAYCKFSYREDIWNYTIENAETIPYTDHWKERLANLAFEDQLALVKTDFDYGSFTAKIINDFISRHSIKPDLVAMHGHTIYHQPENGITYQLGNGAMVSAKTGLPVVCDFRSGDVALGGQGAPLVPFGDRLLFGEYGQCINLGGFANISFESDGKRIACDICPCNIILNKYAGKLGSGYDRDGNFAKKGKTNEQLLSDLNGLPYYQAAPPKSLSWEWVVKVMNPLLDSHDLNLYDILHTLTVHIAKQVCSAIEASPEGNVLITGGGAYNSFLMKLIGSGTNRKIISPLNTLIDFKEALIFAFLGVLRLRGENNVFSSVTGAAKDHSAGSVYGL